MNLHLQRGLGGLSSNTRKSSTLHRASWKPCRVAKAHVRPSGYQENRNKSIATADTVLSPAWALSTLAAGACATWLSTASAACAALQPSFSTAYLPQTEQQQQQQLQAQQQLPLQQSPFAGTIAAAPALHAAASDMTSLMTTPQEQQQQQLPHWPAFNTLDQQQQHVQELLLLATVGEPRHPHWLVEVLGIGVVNMLGLWAVLRVLQWNKDSSTPVTVLRLHLGLRVESDELQQRLRFLRSMMAVEHGMFFTMEEALQEVCQPPRGTQLAYADLAVTPLPTKQEGYDLFKKYAAVEVAAAAQEEAGHVLHGDVPRPECKHRTPLERLMGAEATADLEECTSCVVVTLVMLAKGRVTMPETAIQDVASFKGAMKQLCVGLRTGQLLAVELLLTPDNPADFLSEADMLQDYPLMTDLASGRRAGDISAASRRGSMDDAAAGAVAPAGL